MSDQTNLIKKIGLIKELLQSGETAEAVSLFQKQPANEEFRFIKQALEAKRFEDAVLMIEDFERQSSQMALFYDPIVSALKVELLVQEKELAETEAEHTDLIKLIDNFQVKYRNRVSDYLESVLRLRKEKLEIMAQRASLFKEQLEAAKAEYDEFLEAFNAPIAGVLYHLDEAEQLELKRLYRKSSLICHPDRVKESDQERAREMFEELNDAYLQNNIKKLRLMCELLETVGYFETMRDQLDTSDALRAQIELIRMQMDDKKSEIKEVLSSQAYRTVEGIGEDWETYFARLVENLKGQTANLEQWLLMHRNQN